MDGWDQEQEDLLSFREDEHQNMDVSICKSHPDDAIHMEWRRHARRAGSECMPRQFYILVSMEIGRDRCITGGGKGIPGWFWMAWLRHSYMSAQVTKRRQRAVSTTRIAASQARPLRYVVCS